MLEVSHVFLFARTSLLTLLGPQSLPFWGQTTWNLTGLSPERDCGSKRVKRQNAPNMVRRQMALALSYRIRMSHIWSHPDRN